MQVTRTFVLTGGRKGKSCFLKVGTRHVKFVEGKLTLTGLDKEMEGVSISLARNYQCYPEGSLELAKVLKGEPGYGECDINKEEGHRGSKPLHSGDQPFGKGLTQVSSDDRGGHADDRGTGTEHVSGGDGHANPRIPPSPSGEHEKRLYKAVMQLDPHNDDHWTQPGLPRIDAVELFYGSTGITRRDIENVLPEWTRQQAKEAVPKPPEILVGSEVAK